MREPRIIRTDQPVKGIWSLLSYFESEYNNKEFLKNKFSLSSNELKEISTHLSYAVQTAKEYYQAAEQVSILTQPLQIYYGMVSLSKALFIAVYGRESPSRSHGLQQIGSWNSDLAEMQIKVRKDGTFPQFHSCYCKESLCDITFTMKELLSVVPEVKVSFESIYHEKSNALRIIRLSQRAVKIVDSEIEKYLESGNLKFLYSISGLNEMYYVNMAQRWGNNIILYKRPPSEEEVEDPAIRTVSGEEYFVMSLRKDGKNITLPELSSHFMIMYILGMLSRYKPKKWGEIVKGEESGEIYIIQNFLEATKRKFPNLILNELRDRQFIFLPPEIETVRRAELDRDQLEQIYKYINEKMVDEMRRRGIPLR